MERCHSGRVDYLDGLRGITALSVVFYHLAGFLPVWEPISEATPLSVVIAPAAALGNGLLAVAMFFVLSGIVISSSADHKPEFFPLWALKRYLRLAIPAAAAVFIAWALIALLGPSPAVHTLPSIGAAIRMALYDPFIRARSDLNEVLWTMRGELVGSVAVYAICAFAPNRLRVPIFMLFALLTAVTGRFWYIGFPIGGMLYCSPLKTSRCGPVVLLLGLTIGGLGLGTTADFLSNMVDHVTLSADSSSFIHALGAALVVVGVTQTASARRFLATPFSRWFGRISFGLYLIHTPVIGAVSYFWHPAGIFLAPFLLLCLMASLAAGWGLTKLVDEPTLRLLRGIAWPRSRAAVLTN